MARYSDFVPMDIGIERFRRSAGNYVVAFSDGSFYIGRQCKSTNRIKAAANKWHDAIAVKFMRDHDDDECLRASREKRAIRDAIRGGVRLRNLIHAAVPMACRW